MSCDYQSGHVTVCVRQVQHEQHLPHSSFPFPGRFGAAIIERRAGSKPAGRPCANRHPIRPYLASRASLGVGRGIPGRGARSFSGRVRRAGGFRPAVSGQPVRRTARRNECWHGPQPVRHRSGPGRASQPGCLRVFPAVGIPRGRARALRYGPPLPGPCRAARYRGRCVHDARRCRRLVIECGLRLAGRRAPMMRSHWRRPAGRGAYQITR